MSLSEKLEAARVALGKRKERELQALAALAPAKADPGKKPALTPAPTLDLARGAGAGGNDNKLLAGQLAHEFLTYGTLLGRRVEPSGSDPAKAPAPAPAPASAQTQAQAPAPAQAQAPAAREGRDPKRRYAEVSWLLMASGAHIPGVVNPTQLGRWLKIED